MLQSNFISYFKKKNDNKTYQYDLLFLLTVYWINNRKYKHLKCLKITLLICFRIDRYWTIHLLRIMCLNYNIICHYLKRINNKKNNVLFRFFFFIVKIASYLCSYISIFFKQINQNKNKTLTI